MGRRGELNVGQLARQRYGGECVLIGFTTFDGHVTAASNWGEPPQRRRVRPALRDSYETLFHDAGAGDWWLPSAAPTVREALATPRLERAIGVIYRPETERQSHYFHARLSDQFDAVIHLDHTRALEPLERNERWDLGEPPETYPSGL
jgi:erythromycin esterase-like protein